MFNNDFINPSAIEIINNKELEEIINCFGSLMTMISNKPISCVTFFLMLMKNNDIKQSLIDITDTEWYNIVYYMAYRYPILNKSKKIK